MTLSKDLREKSGADKSHKSGPLLGTLRMEKYILPLKHGPVLVNQ